jgi:ketosteroid isomerase-like protein
MHTAEGHAFVDRLAAAVNAHDLESVVACFAAEYRNETPAHPSRGFTGADQVRRNWQQIFGFIPDVQATVLRVTTDGDTVWSEWEHRGTRRDGSRHLMRGVVIFGLVGNTAAWARFYLEPVDEAAASVDAAVRRQVAPAPAEPS